MDYTDFHPMFAAIAAKVAYKANPSRIEKLAQLLEAEGPVPGPGQLRDATKRHFPDLTTADVNAATMLNAGVLDASIIT